MKTGHQERIEKFMHAAGQEVPASPTIPDEKTRILRAKLIMEEALETVEALGVDISFGYYYYDSEGADYWQESTLCMENIVFDRGGEPDLPGIVDGCSDLSVVTIGTLSACGVSDDPILKEVDAANMRKFGPGGHRREDGKWIKPDDFVGPDILSRLMEME